MKGALPATELKRYKKILDEAYNILSSAERMLCWIYALSFQDRMNLSDAYDYIKKISIGQEEGKLFTTPMMRKMFDALHSAGILDSNRTICRYMRHQLILDALQSSLRPSILQKMRHPKVCSQTGHSDLFDPLISLYLEVYLLNDSSFSQKEIEVCTTKLLSHPAFDRVSEYFNQDFIDPDWIEQLPIEIRAFIFGNELSGLWLYNHPIPDLEKKLSKFRPYLKMAEKYPQIRRMFTRHAIYSADVRDITPQILEMMKSENTHPAVYAVLKFLQGHRREALELFEKIKSQSEEKLTGILAIYYIFAALCNPNVNLVALSKFMRKIAKKETLYEGVFEPLLGLISYLQTQKPPAILNKSPLQSNKVFSVVIYALCQYWIDRRVLVLDLNFYLEIFKSIRDQLPGVARILAEVCTAIGDAKIDLAPYKKFMEQQSPPPYALSFLEIVSVKEVWEESLQALERLYLAEKSVIGASPAVNSNQMRMAWLVNPSEYFVIGALEQKVNAKGQWTKGRPIALERLKKKSGDFDYVTDQDLKIMSTIQSQMVGFGWYHEKEEFTFKTAKTFLALIDHPYIIDDESGLSIEFVKGEIELQVKEEGDFISISLSEFTSGLGTVVKKETGTRYQIIDFTEAHVALSKIIGPLNKLSIPKESKKRIKTIVKAMGQQMSIQSNLGEDAVRKGADGTLHVHLTPLNEGMKVNLFIRPFGVEGPYFKPGHGFQTPQAVVKNKPQRVLRQLTQERERADRLIAAIEPLYLNNAGSDEWILDNPTQVLETLSQLQGFPEAIKLYWPNGQKMNVTSPMHSTALSLRVKGNLEWFSLEGELRIDEKTVMDLKNLLDLIGPDAPRFVQIGDAQFLALTDHFKQLLGELKALSQVERGKLKFHTLSTSAVSEIAESVADFSTDEQWATAKQRLQNALSHQPKVPNTLKAELRPYQEEGFQWLSRLACWGVGACLADDMGLGKTVQALALILEQASKGPTLIVAPTSVCHNWLRETLRFAPTLQPLLHADNRQADVLSNLAPMQMLITSYGLLHNESELLKSIRWQVIILDEAQVIKNVHTKRSQAAMQLCGNVKVILTGTPLENRLSELWNLFQFINPGLLGSYESFNKRFADPIEQKKDPAARQALKKLIQPFVLRRLKNQVLTELPPRIEKTLVIPFTNEEQAFYEALRRSAVEKFQAAPIDEKSRIHILAEITRLRRACCHPSLVAPEIDIGGAKLNYFLELLDELRENNHRALVFSQFVGFLGKVRAELDSRGIFYQYLDGSTPIDERQRRVNAFQNGEGELFLISLRAGGTGLNLTAADYVVHLDPWWNPAVEDQASDRAHRIGQTRPVTIYRIIMEGTIEEKMLRLHDNKRDLATDLLDGTNLSGKLSDQELLALLEK